MLTKAAHWLVCWLFADRCDDDQRVLCEYGCELWLYTILSTFGLLILGILFGYGLEAVVIITVFYLCQTNGGGYHASTHIGCFATMVCGMLAGFTMLHLPERQFYLPAIGIVSMFILLMVPLCLHANKCYLRTDSQQLKRRSQLTTIGIVAVVVGSDIMGIKDIFYTGCVALLLSALSRAGAVIQNKRIVVQDNKKQVKGQ